MSKIKIQNLKQYLGNGWQWDVREEAEEEYETTKVTHYRTNYEGQGLWVCGTYTGKWAKNYEDKQIAGTCQFSLSKNKGKAQRELRAYFNS